MMHPGHIEVVLLTPAKAHPLAAALRTIVERVARRPGVRFVERAEGGPEPASDVEVRLVVGLEAPAAVGSCALALMLDVDAVSGYPIWSVPAAAFGQPIDGVERVQRLGSLLAACLDLASSPEGRELIGAEPRASVRRGERSQPSPMWNAPGVTYALAGTAHLSADALQGTLARGLATRAAGLMLTALEEGRAWQIDDWSLPAELVLASVSEALQAGEEASALRERGLAAAEGLAREVAASVDQALATHGLGALIPLQAALDRLMAAARVERDAVLPHAAPGTPSEVAVRAAEATLAALPRPLPGSMLLAFGWAAPTGALAGLALGPGVAAGVAGSGHALFAAAGTATFLAGAGLARLWSWTRRRVLRGSVEAARRDYDAACAAVEHARHAALGPEIVSGALHWFREQLGIERRRLRAIELQVRSLGRLVDGAQTALGAPSEPANGTARAREIDAAVDLAPAKALLDPAPEPLVQRVRGEISGSWRDGLPTLLDLAAAARGLAAGRTGTAPWVERSDLARALVAPLARALAIVEEGLARLVPRGLPVRRVTLMPAPFDATEVGARGDVVFPCSGDAHLLVLWRSA